MVGGGALLDACGKLASQPTTAVNQIVIKFTPTVFMYAYAPKIVPEILTQFENENKGIKVEIVDWLAIGNTNGAIAAALGGGGADIFWDNRFQLYLDAGILAPLDKYLQQDGIQTSIWPKGQMDLYTTSAGVQALPSDQGCALFVVWLDLFDAAGISYPDASWTSEQFVAVAKSMTNLSASKPTYGASIYWHRSGTITDGSWALEAFGGGFTNADHTQSTLGTANSIKAGQWIYESLLSNQYAVTQGLGSVAAHNVAMTSVGTYNVWNIATTLYGKKWEFLPYPLFPQGRMTYGTNDWYGLNVTSKHPDQAWLLLKWVTAQTAWQTAGIKLTMQTPSINSLWPQWLALAEQAVPPFKNKGLQWIQDAAVNGYARPAEYYASSNAQIATILGAGMDQIYTKNMTVEQGFPALDAQINGVLAAAKTAATQASQTAAQISSVIAGNGSFQAPPTTGTGTASSPTTYYAWDATSNGGTLTLLGDGKNMYGSDDDTTYAATASTAPTGDWSAELSALANVTPGALSNYSKIGLMVRADLSSNAMYGAILLTGGAGASMQFRQQPDGSTTQLYPPNATTKTGLISPAYLTTSVSAQSANYVAQPLWLRTTRNGLLWQFYTSLDGKTWTTVGPSLRFEQGGMWVGLFACADNGGTGKYIRSTFDHLSFTPTTFVQIGTSGVPPTAGAVPTGWATLSTPVPASSSASASAS